MLIYKLYDINLVKTVDAGLTQENYAKFVETGSSKYTLHDTVWITYYVQINGKLDFNSKDNGVQHVKNDSRYS